MDFPVNEASRVRNRYGNFVRFGSLHLRPNNGDEIIIEALYKQGAPAAGIALTQDDARQLLESLQALLGKER